MIITTNDYNYKQYYLYPSNDEHKMYTYKQSFDNTSLPQIFKKRHKIYYSHNNSALKNGIK